MDPIFSDEYPNFFCSFLTGILIEKQIFSGLSVFITKFNVSYVSLTEETKKNEIYSDLSAMEKKNFATLQELVSRDLKIKIRDTVR